MIKKLKPLQIGDLKIPIPIVQGGMGVKISTSSLVAAVANCGAAGTLSAIGLGYGTAENKINFPLASKKGFEKELEDTKKLTNGVFGANIMVAVSNYDDLVKTADEYKVDFIASGAGLPLHLPQLITNKVTKLIPIVSSARAAELIIKTWKRRYNRIPDAFIAEGPLAGGHLGFKFDELIEKKRSPYRK